MNDDMTVCLKNSDSNCFDFYHFSSKPSCLRLLHANGNELRMSLRKKTLETHFYIIFNKKAPITYDRRIPKNAFK